jgi:predicted nucleotidyltransferase
MPQGAELAPRELRAVGETISRVRRGVEAQLEHALLFGSRARGTARADSDVDLLLVFRRLPPDREPQAGQAERIAGRVAARTGVPLGVWSVSLEDFLPGVRTPMLVDALDDAVPLWSRNGGPPSPAFTPADARFCAARLLDRVAEGSGGASARRGPAEGEGARRVRDDLVRLCTALLLLAGETRPRRGEVVRRALARLPRESWSPDERLALAWVARSFPDHHVEPDDAPPVPPPPVPRRVLLGLVARLGRTVASRLGRSRAGGGFVRGSGRE